MLRLPVVRGGEADSALGKRVSLEMRLTSTPRYGEFWTTQSLKESTHQLANRQFITSFKRGKQGSKAGKGSYTLR